MIEPYGEYYTKDVRDTKNSNRPFSAQQYIYPSTIDLDKKEHQNMFQVTQQTLLSHPDFISFLCVTEEDPGYYQDPFHDHHDHLDF